MKIKTSSVLLAIFVILSVGIFTSAKTIEGKFISIATDSIALENDYVRVLKNATIDSATDVNIFDKRIIIALTTLTIRCKNIDMSSRWM